jgi:metal-responsive CopG/Arc/MetJ family transcriptional regulator
MGMVVITFKIDRDMLELVEATRISLNMNRSEFIRHAIEYYIEHEYKPKQQIPKARVEKIVRF